MKSLGEIVKMVVEAIEDWWHNYLVFLDGSFDIMSPEERTETIRKFSMAFSIGITVLMISCFYSLLPQSLRVIVVPIGIGGAWWFGSKVLPPFIRK